MLNLANINMAYMDARVVNAAHKDVLLKRGAAVTGA